MGVRDIMKKKGKSNERFKSRGAKILRSRSSGPLSMKEFLEYPGKGNAAEQSQISEETQNHRSTPAQGHAATISNEKAPEQLSVTTNPSIAVRLHVQIRKDLADKLIEAVYLRKRDSPHKKNAATQRIIIEEALEHYFQENPV